MTAHFLSCFVAFASARFADTVRVPPHRSSFTPGAVDARCRGRSNGGRQALASPEEQSFRHGEVKGSSSDSKEGATPPPNLPQVTSTFCKGDALVSLGGLSLLLGHRAGSMRGRADPRTPPRALRREFSATRREFRTEAAGGRWAERTEVETPQHTGRNAVNDSGDFLLTWNIRHASQGGADPLLDPPARAAPPAGQSEGDSLSLLR
eukprot:1181456-Prorocentrum_minimum.AAC.2